MAERDEEVYKYLKPFPSKSSFGFINSKQGLQDQEYTRLRQHLIEDMKMAINIFTLRTNMRKLQEKRRKNYASTFNFFNNVVSGLYNDEEIGSTTLSYIIMLQLVLKHNEDIKPSTDFLINLDQMKTEGINESDQCELKDNSFISTGKQHSMDNRFWLLDNDFKQYLSNVLPLLATSLDEEFEEYRNWIHYSLEPINIFESNDLQPQVLVQTEANVVSDLKVDEVDLYEEIELATLENNLNKILLQMEVQPETPADDLLHALPDFSDLSQRMHCAHCKKKIQITNTYKCLCEKIFCAQHIYSQRHDCSYHYKINMCMGVAEKESVVTTPKIMKL